LKLLAETYNEADIKSIIQAPKQDLGTTPRKVNDLLASLMDLTSGSGDKGTPIVLVKNYFTHYGQG
jgi:F420-0:gamma-glutamyl ligase